jgi:hypothetical protein
MPDKGFHHFSRVLICQTSGEIVRGVCRRQASTRWQLWRAGVVDLFPQIRIKVSIRCTGREGIQSKVAYIYSEAWPAPQGRYKVFHEDVLRGPDEVFYGDDLRPVPFSGVELPVEFPSGSG